MDEPLNASVPRREGRIDPRLWPTLAVAALVAACFAIAEPFLTTVAWAVILAVSVWTAFARLGRALGGRQHLVAALFALAGFIVLFAQSLYMLTLFLLAVLLGQLRHLPLCCPFRVSWWAVSFPLAASAIAALRFAAVSPGLLTDGIAVALLALATIVIVGLLVRTLVGIAKGELRTLSG